MKESMFCYFGINENWYIAMLTKKICTINIFVYDAYCLVFICTELEFLKDIIKLVLANAFYAQT